MWRVDFLTRAGSFPGVNQNWFYLYDLIIHLMWPLWGQKGDSFHGSSLIHMPAAQWLLYKYLLNERSEKVTSWSLFRQWGEACAYRKGQWRFWRVLSGIGRAGEEKAGFWVILYIAYFLCVPHLHPIGQSQDNEKELAALFHLWLETKDQAFCKVCLFIITWVFRDLKWVKIL